MPNQPTQPGDLASAAAQSTPDPTQPIREDYRRKLEQVWREPDDCPICKSSAWTVGELVDVHVRGTPLVGGGSLVEQLAGIGPKVYVYIPVTCIYCGYTIFFHSGVLDIRDTETVKAVPPLRLPKRL